MPNTLSNKKRMKVAARRKLRNDVYKATSSNAVKRARLSIQDKQVDQDASMSSIQTAVKALDRAASKGVIHKNTAARKKSRLFKLFRKNQSAA